MRTNTQVINGRVVISPEGHFDFSARRDFRTSCSALLAAHKIGELDLDLSGVDYLDSAAPGMLLLLKEHANAVRKGVVLSKCRDVVR
jgi:anti-anti-sigma factor